MLSTRSSSRSQQRQQTHTIQKKAPNGVPRTSHGPSLISSSTLTILIFLRLLQSPFFAPLHMELIPCDITFIKSERKKVCGYNSPTMPVFTTNLRHPWREKFTIRRNESLPYNKSVLANFQTLFLPLSVCSWWRPLWPFVVVGERRRWECVMKPRWKAIKE